MDAADHIKSILTMREVAEAYGFSATRAGYISCPFHDERTPSLKLYPDDRGFYCYGCGIGGDVINFVKHIFNINFQQALMKISNDFGLRLPSTGKGRSTGGSRRIMEALELRRRVENRKTELFDNECRLTYEISQAEMAMKERPPTRCGWNATYPAEWVDAVKRLDKLRWELWKNDCEQDKFRQKAGA